MNYMRIGELSRRLEQAEQIKRIADDQIKEAISDLVKEYSVITNELLVKIAGYSKVEAIKLYRDRENCNLKEAMEAIEGMVSK